MHRIFAIALATGFGLVACAANAQGNFPNKPIRVIVPYPAGGIVDAISRVITADTDRWSAVIKAGNIRAE